jgi:C_GCAxxG_C_C family probable redox protein
MEKSEIVLEYFVNGFNCAQSVFTTLSTEMGLDKDIALKTACAFGGGMGRQQHVCGAVTGALMAIGLKYGKAFLDGDEKKIDTYEKTCRFLEEFTAKHGSIQCKELLDGLSMTDEAEYQKILELGLFRTRCDKYVIDAVEIAEKILHPKI